MHFSRFSTVLVMAWRLDGDSEHLGEADGTVRWGIPISSPRTAGGTCALCTSALEHQKPDSGLIWVGCKVLSLSKSGDLEKNQACGFSSGWHEREAASRGEFGRAWAYLAFVSCTGEGLGLGISHLGSFC